MAYPDEIIAELAIRFKLLELQQQQLRDCLMANGVQTAIEERGFNPENLIIRLEISGVQHISVLSSIASQQIVANPTLLKLEEMRKLASANHDAWVTWDRIKSEMQEIHNLPWGQIRRRRQLAYEMYPRISKIPVDHNILMQNSIIVSEYKSQLDALARYTNALTAPMEEAAVIYFANLFEQQNKKIIDSPAFRSKGSGVQLGEIMVINYVDSVGGQHRIEYFIKTHQHGSTSATSSVKPVDPKEILVYKILEYIGFGPKTHYFYHPIASTPGGFFIATQDAGFTKIPGKEKNFDVFDQIIGNYEATHTSTAHDNARKNIIAVDMLSRILRLSDTTTNPGNHGRVTVNKERSKWKLLDFRILSEPHITYLRKEIFDDFCIGNGAFSYDAKNFLKGIFRDPTTERKKFLMAHEVVEEFRIGKPCQSRGGRKMPLLDAMGRAYNEVQKYITEHHESLRLDLDAALYDFEQYFKAAQANFDILTIGINEKHVSLAVLHVDTNETSSPPKPSYQ